MSGWLRRQRLRFTTSFHTRFPEYLQRALPVPARLGYALERWFHGRAEHTLVGTQSLMHELQRARGRAPARALAARRGHRALPSRAAGAATSTPIPRPIWLYVGRVAVEKSLEDFLELPLPGTKVVVGDGPAREELQRRFPDAVWRGWRFGEELAAHFASADCFVFPSRTETFGNVILEALASGLPVASVPAPGPTDLIEEGVNGAIDDDLLRACLRALRCSREAARGQHAALHLAGSHDISARTWCRCVRQPRARPSCRRPRPTERLSSGQPQQRLAHRGSALPRPTLVAQLEAARARTR